MQKWPLLYLVCEWNTQRAKNLCAMVFHALQGQVYLREDPWYYFKFWATDMVW